MNGAVRSAAMTPEQLAALNGSEWFAALEPAFAQAVLASSRVMALAADETVFHRGDASDGIYCVLSGAVCFGAIAPSGRGSIVALAEAPQWFGEVALFDGGPRTHDAWADISSTVLHLPSRHLTKILADDPAQVATDGPIAGAKAPHRALPARGYGAGTSQGPAGAMSHPSARGLRPAQGRAVLPRARLAGALGMMLSLSRQTVNELLRHMEQEAIIQCQRGGVRVLDAGRLREVARGSA